MDSSLSQRINTQPEPKKEKALGLTDKGAMASCSNVKKVKSQNAFDSSGKIPMAILTALHLPPHLFMEYVSQVYIRKFKF